MWETLEGEAERRVADEAEPRAGVNLTVRFLSGASKTTREEEDCSLRA